MKNRMIIETLFVQGMYVVVKSLPDITLPEITWHIIFWLEMDLDKIGQLSLSQFLSRGGSS